MLIANRLTSGVMPSPDEHPDKQGSKAVSRAFGQWIRSCREHASLTQKEVAKAAGIHEVQLSRIETGESGTKRDTVIALADAIGIRRGVALDKAGFKTVDDSDEDGAVDEQQLRRQKLLVWMFNDIPLDCQLDVLASVAGVHTRRSLSSRVHQRHEARSSARNLIEEKFNELDSSQPMKRHPAVTDTPRDVPLPETTPEDLGEENEDEGSLANGQANGTNGGE